MQGLERFGARYSRSYGEGRKNRVFRELCLNTLPLETRCSAIPDDSEAAAKAHQCLLVSLSSKCPVHCGICGSWPSPGVLLRSELGQPVFFAGFRVRIGLVAFYTHPELPVTLKGMCLFRKPHHVACNPLALVRTVLRLTSEPFCRAVTFC